jgi:hypothetical protein
MLSSSPLLQKIKKIDILNLPFIKKTASITSQSHTQSDLGSIFTMAKSARASTNKSNNVKLKSRVFGPVETARTERLSAKLIELASQPRPSLKEADNTKMEVESGKKTQTLAICEDIII